jgi:hypothetical protein
MEKRAVPSCQSVPCELHVYCDESGTTDRFLVYGGLITTKDNADILDAVLAKWLAQNGLRHEVKWHRTSPSTLERYKAFVDLFFQHAARHHVHCAAMIVDKRSVDYRSQRKRDEMLSFYVFYYRFIMGKFCKYIHDDGFKMWIFLDERSELTPNRLGTMYNVLNRALRRDEGFTVDAVQYVDERRSKDSCLLQLADVIMGAVHYQANEKDKAAKAALHKIALARHVAARAMPRTKGWRLNRRTAPRRVDFEIWPFQFVSKPRFSLWAERDRAADRLD